MKRIILAITLISMMLITGVVYALSPILDGDDSGDWGVNPTTCTIGNAGCSRILDDPQDIGDTVGEFCERRSAGRKV